MLFSKVCVLGVLIVAAILMAGCGEENYLEWERQQWLRPRARDRGNLALVTKKVKGDIEEIIRELALCTSCETYWEAYLAPVRGKYFLTVPKDPWGRDYLFDGSVSFVGTYGRDGRPGGVGLDADIVDRFAGPLTIEFVRYDGKWGRVKKGNELRIHFGGLWRHPFKGWAMNARPLRVVDEDEVLKSIRLFRSTEKAGGWEHSLYELNTQREVDRRHSWKVVRPLSCERTGTLVLRSAADAGVAAVELDGSVWLDLGGDSGGERIDGAVRFGIAERYSSGGPLDPQVYGPGVMEYWRYPECVGVRKGNHRGGDDLRGIKLVR